MSIGLVFLTFLILSTSVFSDEVPCRLHAEILLVQDISDSYEDDLANLASQTSKIFAMLSEEFDGFQFGMTTFTDAYPCGYKNDHCAAIVQTLTSPEAIDAAATRRNVYYLRAGGGSDFAENLFGAVVRSVISPEIGWSPKGARRPNGVPIVRILIATTDFVSQLPGGKRSCGIIHGYEPNLQPFPIGNNEWLFENIDAECETVEYPSIPQMIDVLEGKQIYPIFLFGVPYETRQWQYVEFVRAFGYSNDPEERPEFWDPMTGLTSLMTAVFDEQFGFTPTIRQVNHQMDGLADLLRPSLRQISRQHCEVISPTPTTTTTTSHFTSQPGGATGGLASTGTTSGATTSAATTSQTTVPSSTGSLVTTIAATTVTTLASTMVTAGTTTFGDLGTAPPRTSSSEGQDGGNIVGIVVALAAVGLVSFGAVIAGVIYFGFFRSSEESSQEGVSR